MAQHPSFPLYVQDFLTGTMALSPAERGVYVDCLCYQWEVGGVPGDDMERLARVMRCTVAEARRAWPVIASKFSKGEDGLYWNARLESVREEKRVWHESRKKNGARGGRPPKQETTSEPSENLVVNLVVPSSSSSSSVPTEQRDARADALTRTERASRPNPYAHAQVKAPNGRVFWEGPIFDIPDGWAVKALKASNGKAVGSDIVKFARALTERLQRDGAEAPSQGFLAWLDAEWASYRRPAVPDGLRPASEFIEEQKRIAAVVAAEEAEAKANGTYRSLAQIVADSRAARAAERKAAANG